MAQTLRPILLIVFLLLLGRLIIQIAFIKSAKSANASVRISVQRTPTKHAEITGMGDGNAAFTVLVSWPSLPSLAREVEGSVLMDLEGDGERTGRAIIVFNYDPINGANGLWLRPTGRLGIERKWPGVMAMVEEINGTLATGARIVGAFPTRWFLLIPSGLRQFSKDVEHKCFIGSSTCLVTSQGLEALTSTIQLFKQWRFENPGDWNPKLVFGHMTWEPGQLEQEVSAGWFYPCQGFVDSFLTIGYLPMNIKNMSTNPAAQKCLHQARSVND
uniref:Uncharacterized protein n=1 Tax=Mucochytrium quahogii TaxID=96639 RepID=A0A7S2SDA5_9STRA|mmetsp:Transcript_12982/g.21029  ORF Transcript_12982/g.21029 Transcript_12982/m.21029 type:complete len:273 (+) Transcript_12982:87-905(+)